MFISSKIKLVGKVAPESKINRFTALIANNNISLLLDLTVFQLLVPDLAAIVYNTDYINSSHPDYIVDLVDSHKRVGLGLNLLVIFTLFYLCTCIEN